MFDIIKSKKSKYLLFSSLYFIQGIILTIGYLILPLYLIDKGFSLPIATLVIGITMIPWSVKFFWGGIVDYYVRFGRKIFIIIGGIQFAFGLFAAAFIDPAVSIVLFAFFIFLSVSGVVLLDVALDAWAIETSKEDERGKISGAMFAGQRLGRGLSSFLLGYIAHNFGYNYVFIVSALLIIIATLYSLMFKDTKVVKKTKKIRSVLIKEFKKKKTQLISMFALTLFVASGMISIVIPLFLKIYFRLDVAQIGLITSIYPLLIAVGSLVGGGMGDRYGRKITCYIFIIASMIFTALFVFATTLEILIINFYIVGFLFGGYLSVNFALMMDITNPQVGATQFSILTSLANAGSIAGETASGSMVAIFGFSRTFLFSAWFFGPSLLILYLIKLKNYIKKKK
jgi:MFS family permease